MKVEQMWPLHHISYRFAPGGGGGGYSHIRALRVCAAQQGMLSDSGTGYKNHPFDSGTGSIFYPES